MFVGYEADFGLTIKTILIFVFAFSNGWLQEVAGKYREENSPIRGALCIAALGLMAWLSVVWVLLDCRYLMIPDIFGAAIGSYLEIRYCNNSLDIKKIRVTPASLVVSLVCGIQRRNEKGGTPK